MQYGKLINGQIVPAPNPLHVNRRLVYNPSGDLYASVGYKPIVNTPQPDQPEDGSAVYYASRWEEQEGQIVRVWTETDPPEPEYVPTPRELTPAEHRELAYNTVACIEWDGDMLTVTQAAQQWAYYAAEGRIDKTDALTTLIAAAKQAIRAQYPDGEAAENE